MLTFTIRELFSAVIFIFFSCNLISIRIIYFLKAYFAYFIFNFVRVTNFFCDCALELFIILYGLIKNIAEFDRLFLFDVATTIIALFLFWLIRVHLLVFLYLFLLRLYLFLFFTLWFFTRRWLWWRSAAIHWLIIFWLRSLLALIRQRFSLCLIFNLIC